VRRPIEGQPGRYKGCAGAWPVAVHRSTGLVAVERVQRALNSLATWKQIAEPSPSNAQVAWLAGYSLSSYANPRSALKAAGLIEYATISTLCVPKT